eukprot:COSAG05_NODE_3288_length_2175_cov_1.331888_1_plen_31_part_00
MDGMSEEQEDEGGAVAVEDRSAVLPSEDEF